MTLISELINLVEPDQLLEELGTLKAIDPIFRKSLLSHEKDARYIPQPTEWNPDNTKRVPIMSVNPALGENSEIVAGPKVKTGKDVMNVVQDPNTGDIQGIIISDVGEGKQVFVAIRTWDYSSGRFRSSATLRQTGWNFGLNLGYMKDGITEKDFDNLDNRLKNLDKYDSSYQKGSLTLFNYGVDSDKLLRVLNGVMDILKRLPQGAKLELIKGDATRKQKKQERTTAKKGAAPDTRDFEYKKDKRSGELNHYQTDWEKEAKQALRTRLDQYKSNKTQGVEHHDELPAFVSEHGFQEKLRIGNFVYDYYDSKINVGSMIGSSRGSSWDRDAYVEYQLNTNDKSYRDFEDTRPAARYGSDEYEAWAATRPPSKIKIMLKLQGGHIVPSHVNVERGIY